MLLYVLCSLIFSQSIYLHYQEADAFHQAAKHDCAKRGFNTFPLHLVEAFLALSLSLSLSCFSEDLQTELFKL